MLYSSFLAILVFFLLHWYVSAFCQSFFQHRYMAHKMFTMSKGWERFFYILTYLSQGSSFLHPRSYALLHLEHHMHSDTVKDPHSPIFFKDVIRMMLHTKNVYVQINKGERMMSRSFAEACADWPRLDRLADSLSSRIIFCLLYLSFYLVFAPSLWLLLLLPIHILMGPVHGAFVNWCGHKYGYRNYPLKDHSKNTFFFDLAFCGECFQNNHHRFPNDVNFAKRWFEFDMIFPLIKMLNFFNIIQIRNAPRKGD